jgi:hypothetical protein
VLCLFGRIATGTLVKLGCITAFTVLTLISTSHFFWFTSGLLCFKILQIGRFSNKVTTPNEVLQKASHLSTDRQQWRRMNLDIEWIAEWMHSNRVCLNSRRRRTSYGVLLADDVVFFVSKNEVVDVQNKVTSPK